MVKSLLVFVDDYSLENDITKSSIEQYQIAVNRFSVWLGRPAMTTDLEPQKVNAFLRDYAEQVSAHTAQSKRRSLLVLWRAAAEKGLVELPGKIRQIKAQKTLRDYWSLDQVRQLVTVTSALTGRLPVVEINRADYFTGLVLAAYETGLRMADLLKLERSCLDEDWFPVTMQKTGLVHWCRLNPETKRVITRTYDDFAPPRRLCWPTWGRGDAASQAKLVRRELWKAMKIAGLTASDGPFKMLRRSSINAVDQLQPGAGQRQAGHTSATTTQRWYLSDDAAKNRPTPACAIS
jgi:integrase